MLLMLFAYMSMWLETRVGPFSLHSYSSLEQTPLLRRTANGRTSERAGDGNTANFVVVAAVAPFGTTFVVRSPGGRAAAILFLALISHCVAHRDSPREAYAAYNDAAVSHLSHFSLRSAACGLVLERSECDPVRFVLPLSFCSARDFSPPMGI